ncbi:hypothetical protein [Reichenbachiella versicolor]|uniref:hypothetical protein n=1 Tax=Reichenbachiella versicolor TaxID=1821036 RepID=UPI0013A53D48|nr:hypothetical protein [Reichenbachiella versicolor]
MKLSQLLILMCFGLALVSCGDSEQFADNGGSTNRSQLPFKIGSTSIDDSTYPLDQGYQLFYSKDGGDNFVDYLPLLEDGLELTVKVDGAESGIEGLTADWSKSSPEPISSSGNQAVFKVEGDIEIKVSIDNENRMRFLTVNRRGRFFEFDLEDGLDTDYFTVETDDDDDLNDIRAFVYHPGENKFFVSESNDESGHLFSIDLNIDAVLATTLNENEDGGWNSINSLLVSGKELLALVGFGDEKRRLTGFDTNGNELTTQRVVIDDFSSGVAMFYNDKGETIVTKAESSDIILRKINTTTGALTDYITFDTFNNFDHTINGSRKQLTSLMYHEGKAYGIIYDNNGTYDTFFVELDFDNGEVEYIERWQTNSGDRHYTILALPNNIIDNFLEELDEDDAVILR